MSTAPATLPQPRPYDDQVAVARAAGILREPGRPRAHRCAVATRAVPGPSLPSRVWRAVGPSLAVLAGLAWFAFGPWLLSVR